jgi:hypothetical protein
MLRSRPMREAHPGRGGRRFWPTALVLGGAALTSLGVASACETPEALPYYGISSGGQRGTVHPSWYGGETSSDPATCEPSPEPDTSKLCGDEVIPLLATEPRLYFLLDSSGSMYEPIDFRQTKLDAAKTALEKLLRAIGHRVEYALGTFPAPGLGSSGDECSAGRELFPMQKGDPRTCEVPEGGGPVLDTFLSVLSKVEANGGTPLTPTLDRLKSRLVSESQPTFLVLLTDGAPNCNTAAECDADECSLSQLGAQIGPISCGASVNCCDASVTGTSVTDPGTYCLDSELSVKAVKELHEAGTTTFVVGIPGADLFEDVMNDLAVAGGAPRAHSTKYLAVDDSEQLVDTLAQVAAEVIQTCDIVLEDPPDLPVLLNLYLDTELIAAESQNGWTYDQGTVHLLGTACERVLAGEVQQVRVVSGCSTVIK